MVGILIVTHGNLGVTLAECAQHILQRELPHLAVMAVDKNDDPDRKLAEARELVQRALRLPDTGERDFALKLKRSTVLRKIKEARRLDTPDSERLMAVMDMIAQVERMVTRSGDPEGFDAALWLAGWLDAPCPALGGQRPSDYLDTNEGIQVVRGVLARMESGAYA